uniref:Uncharacterized protein n=1 Tax=Alcaligenes xylosoxydans xylosoxydans TaxID=85698 RepID=A0A193PMH6_ALCXX|nr:hypothetical protein [Achromobacter xylosoxidans]
MRFLRRGTCRAPGHHHPDQKGQQCGTKTVKTNSQNKKATPAGRWPENRERRAALAARG